MQNEKFVLAQKKTKTHQKPSAPMFIYSHVARCFSTVERSRVQLKSD